jgi:AcrR family transcriptional regulator
LSTATEGDTLSIVTGLRERKKERTRRQIADSARELFTRKGFAATTVEEICAGAEVSVSTFFRYFPSKEATAFPEAEERIAIVHAILDGAAPDEPLHVTLRRATTAMADAELALGDAARVSYELLHAEPALAAYNQQLQGRVAEGCVAIIARRMALDPATDVRPGVVVGAVFAAINAAWGVWLASGMQADLRGLVEATHDALDAGLAQL